MWHVSLRPVHTLHETQQSSLPLRRTLALLGLDPALGAAPDARFGTADSFHPSTTVECAPGHSEWGLRIETGPWLGETLPARGEMEAGKWRVASLAAAWPAPSKSAAESPKRGGSGPPARAAVAIVGAPLVRGRMVAGLLPYLAQVEAQWILLRMLVRVERFGSCDVVARARKISGPPEHKYDRPAKVSTQPTQR